MNLYLVNKIVQDILDQYMDYETGEITEEGAKKLDSLGIKKEEVIHEMIKAHKNLQMLIDGVEAEIKRLQDRKSTYEKSQGSIMKQVRPHLIAGEKIVTPEFELKWTTSTTVEGLDGYDPQLEFNSPDSLLRSFVVCKVPDPEYRFDKRAIQTELKNEKPNVPVDIYINQIKNPKIK